MRYEKYFYNLSIFLQKRYFNNNKLMKNGILAKLYTKTLLKF